MNRETHTRRALPEDAGRLAEIIVYNNRLNYYPIFGDIEYSFGEYTVAAVTQQFLQDEDFMQNCYLYEDAVIRGFICVVDQEIRKLYAEFWCPRPQDAPCAVTVKKLKKALQIILLNVVFGQRFFNCHNLLLIYKQCKENVALQMYIVYTIIE